MCGITELLLLWGNAEGLMLAAVASIAVAAALNGGFFSAPAAPVAMGLAAGFAAAAGALLLGAPALLTDLYECMGGGCADLYRALLFTITNQSITLFALAAACALAATTAWIPGAGQPAMWAIMALLIAQIASVAVTVGLAEQLVACLQASPVGRRIGPLLATGVVAVLGTVFVYVASGRSAIGTKKGTDRDPTREHQP